MLGSECRCIIKKSVFIVSQSSKNLNFDVHRFVYIKSFVLDNTSIEKGHMNRLTDILYIAWMDVFGHVIKKGNVFYTSVFLHLKLAEYTGVFCDWVLELFGYYEQRGFVWFVALQLTYGHYFD